MVQKFKPTSVSNEVNRLLLLSFCVHSLLRRTLSSDAESKARFSYSLWWNSALQVGIRNIHLTMFSYDHYDSW